MSKDAYGRRKVYDCFCYFNEDMILELRLETLWDHVDVFVISEAVFTQTGQPKPLNFSAERFARYMSKIRYVVVDQLPPGPISFWKNENYQRNRIIDGLVDATPDDLVLVSDLDEIPRPELIGQYDPSRYKRGDFEQRAYSYLLNNLFVERGEPSTWFGSKITTCRYLKEFFGSVTAVRSYKSSGGLRVVKRALFKRFQVQRIANGGWHFTWIMTPAAIITKMEAIAEQEFVKPEYKDVANIRAAIASGRDVLNRDCRYVAVPVTEPAFPAHLVRNQDKYREWIRS